MAAGSKPAAGFVVNSLVIENGVNHEFANFGVTQTARRARRR
jgi:hypothetical protein